MKKLMILMLIISTNLAIAQKQRNVLFGTAIISATVGIVAHDIIERGAYSSMNADNSTALIEYNASIQNATSTTDVALTIYNRSLHDNKWSYDQKVKTACYTRSILAGTSCVLAIIALTINDEGKLWVYQGSKSSMNITQNGKQIGLCLNF